MKTCYPYFRGKQNELLALRDLAKSIAASSQVVPIIEPVNDNSTTINCFDAFAAAEMQFILVANPQNGQLVRKTEKVKALVAQTLWEYQNYVAAIIVSRDTTVRELDSFEALYPNVLLAAIYRGEPQSHAVRNRLLTQTRYYYHVFVGNRVARDFRSQFPAVRRVLLEDHFKRQSRNADFPAREFYTDMNTDSGNVEGVGWGDFSIVGDHYLEKGGGAAHAVALHHIHFAEEGAALEVSHFISDRVETTADPAGKTMEALDKLVSALDFLAPDSTTACKEYRSIVQSGDAPSLGYMKKLAIKQHIETLLL